MVKKSLSEICLFDTFYPHIHMWGTKNDHFLKKEDDEGDHNDDNDDIYIMMSVCLCVCL